MKSVYVEGEGLIVEDGRFFPEANIRAALEVAAKLCDWFNTLPQEVKDELTRLGIEQARQDAMRRGL